MNHCSLARSASSGSRSRCRETTHGHGNELTEGFRRRGRATLKAGTELRDDLPRLGDALPQSLAKTTGLVRGAAKAPGIPHPIVARAARARTSRCRSASQGSAGGEAQQRRDDLRSNRNRCTLRLQSSHRFSRCRESEPSTPRCREPLIAPRSGHKYMNADLLGRSPSISHGANTAVGANRPANGTPATLRPTAPPRSTSPTKLSCPTSTESLRATVFSPTRS